MSLIPFVNNKGRTILIPGHYKISDLIKIGVKQIDIVPPGQPIADGWWQNVHSPMKNKKTSDILAAAAMLMAEMQDHGIEAYTVICIFMAGDIEDSHDTPAQQLFRNLFSESPFWPRDKNGTWDWKSRIFALLLAAEVARDNEQ